MSHYHPYGESINIVKFRNDEKFIIQEKKLNEMFTHKDVKYRNIVLFSIIGAFRKGKSFFLDYCLRYLYANYPSINYPNNPKRNAEKWMGDENEPLSGFSWRSGSTRDTSGIVMWSDIFLHTVERTGEKLAIVVMDTQGLFDNETTPEDNSRIFALGTLISSIQVLNLLGVVQEDQLQYLQFTTEFAKFASDDSHGTAGKPFQHLMFLIRDWPHPGDHEYGITGGKEYLDKFLEIKENSKDILRSVREHIKGSFEKLSCALLPYPGSAVSGSKKGVTFNGSWNSMEDDFKPEFFALIDHLLKEENLICKKINGEYVEGQKFLQFMMQYFELFQSANIPKAQSIYESTIEKQMNILINECFNDYKKNIILNQHSITNEKMIEIVHKMCKQNAILKFVEAKKMGNKDHHNKFRKDLEQLIDDIFEEWKSQTEESVKKIRKEMERMEEELKENVRRKQEQIESERIANEKYIKLQQLKHQRELNDKRYQYELKLAAERLKAEQERSAKLLAEERNKTLLAQKIAAENELKASKNSESPINLCLIM